MSPILTILIPAYNCAKSIEKTIISILNQNYNDYQIFIINDGSTDETESVCKKFSDSRIKIFSLEHLGVVNAYSYGISQCNSKYIMFCDGDDTFKPQILNNVVSKIETSNTDFFSFGYDYVTETGEVKSTVLNGYEEKIYIKEEYNNLILPNAIFNTTVANCYYTLLVSRWCKIYKTDLLKKILPLLNRNCFQMEDNIFTTLCLLESSNFGICNQSIYNYYTNTNTISKGFNPKIIDEYEYSFNYLKEIVSKYEIPIIEEQLRYKYFDIYRVIYRRAAKELSFYEIYKIFKQIKKTNYLKNISIFKLKSLKNKVFYILAKLKMNYFLYYVFKRF